MHRNHAMNKYVVILAQIIGRKTHFMQDNQKSSKFSKNKKKKPNFYTSFLNHLLSFLKTLIRTFLLMSVAY